MSQIPQFLAEGAYGCVHRPSLRCNESKDINYRNKLSKIMSSKNAIKELEEYVLIDKADPKAEFYLGKPETCKFEKSNVNNPPVSKCKIGKQILESNENYDLIIMNDGGDNLEDFAIKMKKASNNASNRKIMTKFWKEAKRLLLGVQAFLKHHMIHHDLKPQNIVYNSVSNRCNIIDFGLMENIIKSKWEAKHNMYGYSFYHWNFPTESIFLNKLEFQKFDNLRFTEKLNYCRKMIEKNLEQMSVLYQYSMITTLDERGDHLKEWSDFFLEDIGELHYNFLLDKSFETYDVYGLGLSLLYVLENTKHLTDENVYLNLKQLFYSMMRPNLIKRLSIEEAIERYNDILSSTEQKIENNEISVLKLEENIDALVKNIKPLTPKTELIADMDPEPIVKKVKAKPKRKTQKSKSAKKCPEGKVLNPKTNRCNKIKTQKSKSAKKCPEGKVLNPKTKRCNKIKTQKSKSANKCPEGKVLNPKTKRCNKIINIKKLNNKLKNE